MDYHEDQFSKLHVFKKKFVGIEIFNALPRRLINLMNRMAQATVALRRYIKNAPFSQLKNFHLFKITDNFITGYT